MNIDALVKTLQLCTAKVIERANIEGRFVRNTALEDDDTMRVRTFEVCRHSNLPECEHGCSYPVIVRVTTKRWLFSTYITEAL